MKKVLTLAVLVSFVAMIAGAAEEVKAPAAEQAAPKAGCFACEKCNKSATKAGKCCTKDMAACHILSIKDGVATGCSCAADCAKCGDVKEGKCACGKAVNTCALTGKFVCEKCKVVTDKAGKCACSADFVEVKAKADAPKAEAK